MERVSWKNEIYNLVGQENYKGTAIYTLYAWGREQIYVVRNKEFTTKKAAKEFIDIINS